MVANFEKGRLEEEEKYLQTIWRSTVEEIVYWKYYDWTHNLIIISKTKGEEGQDLHAI